MKHKILVPILLLAVAVVAGAIWNSQSQRAEAGALAGMSMTLYKSASCGCCANYVAYLKRYGIDVTVENISDADLNAVKDRFGVPREVLSCHTTVIGDYVAEGHLPIEAIEKLVAEKPDIAGIGLGGMPAGSPGMGGAKIGSFSVHQFTNDGRMSAWGSY